MTQKIDVNSQVNQDIKSRLVDRDVYCNVNSLVEFALKHSEDTDSPIQWDDIENLYASPDYGDDEEREEEPQEIFEWWAVSRWLYEKLKAHGAPVYGDGFNHYWGRTTTGQAIMLDGIISDICKEMEILEGQANSWADKK